MSFNFTSAITICSDFGAQKNKSDTVSTVSPYICHEVMGPDATYIVIYKLFLMEINPEYSLEGLMLKLKLQYFGHLMQKINKLEKTFMLGPTEGRRGRKRMRWLDSVRLNGHEFEQTPGNTEGQGSLGCCHPRNHKESVTT